MSNPVGRPLKFKTVEELQAQIDAFFADCDAKGEPYTITGLALFLRTSREILMEYEGRDKFTNTIKEAKMKVQKGYEQRLISRGNAGDIFALKNFGWKDKTEQDVNIKGDLALGGAFEKK